jgi:hypothetical protein
MGLRDAERLRVGGMGLRDGGRESEGKIVSFLHHHPHLSLKKLT